MKVFTIDSSDNVGIGAVSANRHETASVLHIDKSGTGSIHNLLTLRGGTSGQNNGGARIYLGGDNDHFSSILSQHTGNGYTYLAFGTASSNSLPTEKMRIDKDGNVGIGITSPVYKLHVDGDINISTGSSFKINGSDILYTDSDVTTLLNGGITGGLKVTSGKVGFGTSSTPSHKLTVYGEGDAVPENNSIAIISDTNPQLMILGNSLTSDPSINLFYHYSNFDINNIATFKGNQIQTDGEYFRIISFNGDSNDRLRINSTNGNVGIGVTTPNHKLDVDGDINCTGNFKINGNNFVSSYWSTTSPSTNTSDIFYNDNNSITGTGYSPGSIVTITGGISDHNLGTTSGYKMGLIVQHSNRTQGLGIGYNGISQCGSSPNLNLHLRAKGTGTTQIGSSGGIALNVSDSSVGISTAPQTNAKLCIDVADEGTMLCSNDISQFLWRINSLSVWGMYWSTNSSGNDYFINSDSNPNQIVFVGGGVAKAAIGLGNACFLEY